MGRIHSRPQLGETYCKVLTLHTEWPLLDLQHQVCSLLIGLQHFLHSPLLQTDALLVSKLLFSILNFIFLLERHSGAMFSITGDGSELQSWTWGLSVWGLHVLPVSVWVLQVLQPPPTCLQTCRLKLIEVPLKE